MHNIFENFCQEKKHITKTAYSYDKVLGSSCGLDFKEMAKKGIGGFIRNQLKIEMKGNNSTMVIIGNSGYVGALQTMSFFFFQ